MKKPMLQVLIRGFKLVGADAALTILLLPPGSGVVEKKPILCTGHQAFHELCLEMQCGGCSKIEKISFRVCKYKLNPYAPLLKVEIVGTGPLLEFRLKTPSRPSAPKVKLPFGLQPVQRKRKRKCKQTPSKNMKASAPWGFQEIHAQLSGVFPDCEREEGPDADGDGDEEHIHISEDCTGSSTNSSDECQEDESEDSEGEPAEGCAADIPGPGFYSSNQDNSEELLQPAEALDEEQTVLKLDIDRQKRLCCGPPSGDPRPKTYCNQFLGIMAAGVQASARLAACRHCLVKIERNSSRFGYAYSHTKFHSWLHADCALPHLLQEEANLTQARDWLVGFLRDGADSVPTQVRKAASSLEKQLAIQLGQATSSWGSDS